MSAARAPVERSVARLKCWCVFPQSPTLDKNSAVRPRRSSSLSFSPGSIRARTCCTRRVLTCTSADCGPAGACRGGNVLQGRDTGRSGARGSGTGSGWSPVRRHARAPLAARPWPVTMASTEGAGSRSVPGTIFNDRSTLDLAAHLACAGATAPISAPMRRRRQQMCLNFETQPFCFARRTFEAAFRPAARPASQGTRSARPRQWPFRLTSMIWTHSRPFPRTVDNPRLPHVP